MVKITTNKAIYNNIFVILKKKDLKRQRAFSLFDAFRYKMDMNIEI